MTCILHLSDLHIVNQSSWNNMREAVFKKLHDKMHDLPDNQKMIIITGDFHNFWENTYVEATKFIKRLAKETNVDIEQDVFVIPGNHDMHLSDDPRTKKNQSNSIKSTVNDPDEIEDEMTIEMLMDPFEMYSAFVRNLGIYKESDPNPASVHVRRWREKLNILHTNTAIVADGIAEHKNKQLLDIFKMTSEDIRKELSNGLPTIALGHNSFYDLHEKIQIGVSAFFSQEQVNVYLAGDQHRFNKDREKQFIYLNDNFSDKTIPNIICAKCSADSKDKYSDFGFIIHDWNEETGQVNIERYKYDLNKEQNDFECKSKENLYHLQRRDFEKSRIAEQETEEFSKFSELLKKYQNYIKQQCGEIELSGLPTNEEDLKRAYTLDSIFVPMTFNIELRDTKEFFLRADYEKKYLIDNFIVKNLAMNNPIIDNQNQNSFVLKPNEFRPNAFIIGLGDLIPSEGTFRELILADPGAGKTTLLKYIATNYCLHKNAAEDNPALTERVLFPIWIRCRDIKGERTSITEIINNIPRLAEWGFNDNDLKIFSEMVQNQIDRGNALLLIDGLDEIVSEKERKNFAGQLYRFADNNKSVNIIISSRKKGFSIVSDRLFSNYIHLEINPLNKSSIRDLCVRWYNLVYRSAAESIKEANKLSETIIQDERLLRLARNPLMLTTLLLVKRRLGNLPTKRAGLYHEAVQVLLESWNSEQHEKIDLDESKYQLAYIAFWMSTNKDKAIAYSVSRITKTNLLILLNDFRKSFPHLIYSRSLTPTDFINIVERRSALLIRTGVEKAPDGHEEPIYEFQHLTFQEYLAAYAVCKCCYPNADPNDRDGQVLISYLTDPNMKEIIQLAASIEPFCAHKLSEEALELFEKTTSEEHWNNLRSLLLQFVADEVAIKPEMVNTIFDKCFDDGIQSSDKNILKQIVVGKNGSTFLQYLQDADNKYHDGYPHWTTIYSHLSGEVLNIEECLAMMKSTDPKQIIEGLSLINTYPIAVQNKMEGNYIDQISRTVYSLLDFDNVEVRIEALSTIYLLEMVNTSGQFIKYLNAVINEYNDGHMPSVISVDDFNASNFEAIPANTITRLNEQAMAKILDRLHKVRFNSFNEYKNKITLLAYASFGNADIDELKKAYEFIKEFRKSLKAANYKVEKLNRSFGELLSKVEDVTGDVYNLYLECIK